MSTIQIVEGALASAAAGVLTSWIYGRFLRSRQDRSAQDKAAAARDRADSRQPAARVHLTQSPIPWVGWISDEIIEVPHDAEPGVNNTRFPGYDRAIQASKPYQVHGAELVNSRLSFDLTGIHESTVKVTRIRAVIDERKPVPIGTVYYAVPQGIIDKDVLSFDLGSPDLDARVQDTYGAPTSLHYLDCKVTELEKSRSVGFIAEVFAPLFGGEDIRYHFEISFAAGPPVTVYNEAGRPFQIVSYPITAQRAYIAASTSHRPWPNYPRYGGELEPDAV